MLQTAKIREMETDSRIHTSEIDILGFKLSVEAGFDRYPKQQKQ